MRAHGLSVAPPDGWEAQLRVLEPVDLAPEEESGAPEPMARTTALPDATARTASVDRGDPAARINLHVANFPLPRQRGDFGGGAVEEMGFRHAFVSLVEYDRAAASDALFARQGMPRRLRARDFDPQALQRTITGHAGVQRFFSEAGRAFCLYVVLGSHRMATMMTPAVNDTLATVAIDEAPD